ncbi:MAG: hypothetical protein PHW19_12855, partial [Salinivirgaceae bacterium]|nr:hypothetical protein [Salinivirgaceae bacterium]
MAKVNGVKVYYYSGNKNFGDALNIELLKNIFQLRPTFENEYRCQLVAVGSLLEAFLHGSNKMRLYVKKTIYPRLHIWGTGFIDKENSRIIRPQNDAEIFYRNVTVHALRGILTKIRVEHILGRTLKIPTGDPGLLASRLLSSNLDVIGKKYKFGIIPHYVDKDLKIIQNLKNKSKDSVIIDVFDSPLNV